MTSSFEMGGLNNRSGLLMDGMHCGKYASRQIGWIYVLVPKNRTATPAN